MSILSYTFVFPVSKAGMLENVLVTLRHVGAEWMATMAMSSKEENKFTSGGAVTVFAPTEKAWSKVRPRQAPVC